VSSFQPGVANNDAARRAETLDESATENAEAKHEFLQSRRVPETVIPPGKPGRKRRKEITAALADWNAGMRGIALYRKHIAGFDRMSCWRRKAKSRSLMDAIHARKRREQRRRTREAEIAAGQIST
jgi:hypothetical protein